MNSEYVIEMQNLTKYYGQNKGIEHLNLTVNKGDFFGCIGPNGAGKSTAIRTLLGLIAPTSGTARLFGCDVRDHQHTKQLERIGYLPSEGAFWSGMRVRDVIRLSADLRKQDCTAEAESLCERLALDSAKKVDALSLGNRKKLSIVCALQHRPELYILDEPTSGLDPLMQAEFFRILDERHRDGATIFLSSHILSEVQHHCSRAAMIRDGQVILCDRVENLQKSSARRVLLRGVVLPDALRDMAADIKTSADAISFLYHGNPAQLIRGLQNTQPTELLITEPDLDEIFLHYYQNSPATEQVSGGDAR